MTYPQIRQIVADAYANGLELPDSWDPGQRAAFLDANAAIFSRRVAELAAQFSAAAVAAWVRRHGAQPDHPTHAALLKTARESAMDMVLFTGFALSTAVPDGSSADDLPEV